MLLLLLLLCATGGNKFGRERKRKAIWDPTIAEAAPQRGVHHYHHYYHHLTTYDTSLVCAKTRSGY